MHIFLCPISFLDIIAIGMFGTYLIVFSPYIVLDTHYECNFNISRFIEYEKILVLAVKNNYSPALYCFKAFLDYLMNILHYLLASSGLLEVYDPQIWPGYIRVF